MKSSLCVIATIVLTLAPATLSAKSGGPPPTGGTIAIEPVIGDGQYDPALHVFVDAASEALTARGFTVFDDPAHAAAVVELRLDHADVGTGLAKVRGQGTPSMIGTGVSVPFSTGASELVRLQRTRLELRFRRRGETAFAWDGAAVTVREAGTREGADAAVAATLSRALLQSYPAQPKDVIGVP